VTTFLYVLAAILGLVIIVVAAAYLVVLFKVVIPALSAIFGPTVNRHVFGRESKTKIKI
jgi:hypothetical protein